MKKIILILVLLLGPVLVSAAPVNVDEVCYGSRTFDKTKYNFIATVDGTEATLSREYPSSNYVLQCCYNERLGKNACDVFELKSSYQQTTTTPEDSSSKVSCTNLKSSLVLIGHVVFLAKILIPIVIIGFGMVDFFHAVIGSKEDELKKSVRSLIFRTISGVVIFFLPAFIDLIFSWVSGWEENYQAQYQECFKCIWDVNSCK